MFPRTLLALALACAPAAHADADLDALKAEIAALKQAYEGRIAALESRLAAAESRAAAPVPMPAPPAAAQVAGAAGATGFNPEASLILSGQYAHRDALPERGLGGFLPAGGHEHGTERGFALEHTELVLSANVDPHWRGLANLAFADETVEVEEAWFQSIGLGHGLNIKGGRFLSGLGYMNEQHPHAWDFVDAPLMYQALFGEHYIQDGLQVKWLAPTETFLELGLEAGAGNAFPGTGGLGNGLGAWTAFLHLGGDVGVAHGWRAGLAYLGARPRDREGHWEDDAAVEAETLLSGRSRTWVADLVWKWAPDGNPRQRNFTFQTEYFRRLEAGQLTCLDNTADGGLCPAGDLSDAYRASQSGWYAQGVYQFMPAWRLGLRHDRLDAGSQSLGAGFAGVLSTLDYRPTRNSLMLDWSPSEFSRLRLQYARDKSMPGIAEDQWTLQYVMSLGAHGAHKF